MATADPQTLATSRLLHVFDPMTQLRFLIDTGAEVSVVPATSSDRSRPSTTNLKAANGSAIKTFGQRPLTLSLSLRRTFDWFFVVADVTTPIIGADFLSAFGLLVDPFYLAC